VKNYNSPRLKGVELFKFLAYKPGVKQKKTLTLVVLFSSDSRFSDKGLKSNSKQYECFACRVAYLNSIFCKQISKKIFEFLLLVLYMWDMTEEWRMILQFINVVNQSFLGIRVLSLNNLVITL